jgi:outer membrane protein insertion porin family
MALSLLAALFLVLLPGPSSLHLESVESADLQLGEQVGERATAQPLSGVIQEIRFTGLQRVFAETLRAHIQSRAGSSLDRAVIERDIRALMALGWFDSVRADVFPVADSTEDGDDSALRLVFTVSERPYLSRIDVHGSDLLSRQRVLQLLSEKKISLKVAAPVDRFEVWRAEEAIDGELQELGHPLAVVRVRLDEVSRGCVRARFEIADGPHVSVAQVAFAGNRAFSDELLQRQMKYVAPGAHFAGLRGKNIYTRNRLGADLTRIENYYRNHGYPEVRIGEPAVELDQNVRQRRFPWLRARAASRYEVTVPVTEGGSYQFGAVNVREEQPTAESTERIAAIVAKSGVKPGEPYSRKRLDGLSDALARSPSQTANVSTNVTLERETRTATITSLVGRQRPYALGRIAFSGNRRFSDGYYRRHIPLKEGELFDPKKLEIGLDRLARTGYVRPFKAEDVDLKYNDSSRVVEVSVRVTEIGQQRISLSGGPTSLGSTIAIAYSVFNLFGGQELISSHIEGGPDSLHLALDLTEEAIFGTRASFSLALFQDVVRPRLSSSFGNQHVLTARRVGFTFGGSYPITPNETLSANYTLAHEGAQYAVQLPPSLTGLMSNAISSNTSSHSLGLGLDGGNNRQHWNTATSVSGGFLGGDENLVRSSLQYEYLQCDPLSSGRNTWAFRSYVAGVSSFRGNLLLPSRYFAGGELLRGFRTGEIAPYAFEDLTDSSGATTFHATAAGADLLTAMNTEYRVPVAPRTKVVAFFDFGSGWLLPNWLGSQRPTLLAGTNGVPRASTGVELQWSLPVVEQPMRFDLSLNPLRLAKSFLLPDGSRFRAPDRRVALSWTLGSLF